MRERITDDMEKRRLVEEWDESGLSAAAFAEPRGIHPATLGAWGRAIRGPLRRRSRSRSVPRSVDLVELPEAPAGEVRLEVEFGDDRRLVVAGALTSDMIVALVTALEAMVAE